MCGGGGGGGGGGGAAGVEGGVSWTGWLCRLWEWLWHIGACRINWMAKLLFLATPIIWPQLTGVITFKLVNAKAEPVDASLVVASHINCQKSICLHSLWCRLQISFICPNFLNNEEKKISCVSMWNLRSLVVCRISGFKKISVGVEFITDCFVDKTV